MKRLFDTGETSHKVAKTAMNAMIFQDGSIDAYGSGNVASLCETPVSSCPTANHRLRVKFEPMHYFSCSSLVFFCVIFSWITDIDAQSPRNQLKTTSRNNYAIIIPVAAFPHLDQESQRPFTINDAGHLSATLHERGGFTIYPPEKSNFTPTKKNIEDNLPFWLANGIKEEDTVIVYVNTHGFADVADRHIP